MSRSLWSYLPVLVLGFALQRTLTPTMLWRQMVATTSWRPFWHTNTCLAGNCVAPLASCASSLQCMRTVGCVNGCILEHLYQEDKVAACAYLCEMTHGYQNTEFTDLIGCMLDSQCLEQYPEDGPCIGANKDGLQTVTKMEDIEGDWWVLRGINCGQAPYPGGYDWYPCQHERFIKDSDGQWINKVIQFSHFAQSHLIHKPQVTYCGGSQDSCVTDMIVTVANVSMTAPGVVHHDYTDAPLSPQGGIQKFLLNRLLK